METEKSATEVVLSYIGALDKGEYEKAAGWISEVVKIFGPAGESFGTPGQFVKMMSHYPGKYDIKKTFTDGDDICLLYDLVTKDGPVYMASWYQVKGGKISFIRTVFDPQAFK